MKAEMGHVFLAATGIGFISNALGTLRKNEIALLTNLDQVPKFGTIAVVSLAKSKVAQNFQPACSRFYLSAVIDLRLARR
jgi:hypothetical protein